MKQYGFDEHPVIPKSELSPVADEVKVRGFSRIQIKNQDGSLAGDSGWLKNRITDTGFQHYIVELMVGTTGSSRVTYAALGKGTEPGTTGTSLQSEHVVRETVVLAESNSKTVRYTATFGSGIGFVTDAQTLRNVGLFATSEASAGSILCGNTFATSSVDVNQNVNMTYEIQFATS